MPKPFCYVTKNGSVVKSELLESYVKKEQANDEKSKRLLIDAFADTYGQYGLLEPLYNPQSLIKLLEMNTYHYRCVKTKARDTAGLGWKFEPLHDDVSSEQERLVEEAKKIIRNFHRPLTKTLEEQQVDYESVGYGAIEVIREGYDHLAPVAQMYQVPAHTLRIHQSGNKFLQIRGNRRVWFKAMEYEKDVDYKTGEEHPVGSLNPEERATELLWTTNYTPRSSFYGAPDIIPAIGAIHGDISRRDYNIAFFDNYGVPAYAVFISGDYDPGEIDEKTGQTELEDAIQEHFKELNKNPHSTLVLSVPSRQGGDVKVEFKPLSVETKEASFRLYRQDNRDEVLSTHGVPGYRVGVNETGSLGGSTARESTEIYKDSVIVPRQDDIEDLMNRYILKSYGITEYEFKLRRIDTRDDLEDLKLVEGLFKMAGITPNQIIRHFGERFGLEELDHPAMNAYYINGSPITLESSNNSDVVDQTMKSLKSELINMAKKHEEREDERLQAIKSLSISGDQ